MMKPTDRILDTTRGDPETAISYAKAHGAERIQEVEAFIRECYRLCPLVGIDASLVVSQSAHETSDWDSSWWVERLNSSGLGITGDAAQNQASGTWQTGTDAARGQIVHLWQYTSRDFSLPTVLFPFQDLDPRLGALCTTMFPGTVRTLNDLTGRWAVDRQYATLIAERGNAIWPTLPDQTTNPQPSPGETPVPDIVFGRVPHPPFVDRLVLDSQTAAYNNLGPLVPVGVDQHSMVGSLLGTDGWFKRGRGVSTGLTNYGIGGSTDGALDGVIYRWNDPTGKAHPGVSANRAGWANGGSDGLEGDGPLFVRKFGVDGINRNLVSIERSDGGVISTPMSPKQFAAIVALTAYWFDQANVPWNTFPLNPKYGCVTHLLHKETATKDCPFPAVYDRIDEIQNAVRTLLKQHQTTGIVPPPMPIPPPTPIEPDHSWFGVYQESELKARFSDLIRHNADGTTTTFTFARTGVVTNAWIARAAKEKLKVGDIPVPDDWFVLESQFTPRIDIVAFGGGAWLLERHNEPEGFRWFR